MRRIRDTRKGCARRLGRRWIVAAFGGFVAFTGGAAFAFVSASGSGTGAAAAGTMQTVTVTAFVGGDAPTSKLYPGGPAADVILRVNNPNSFSVQLTAISANGAITADASHSGCTTTGVTFTPPASPNIAVPAGSSLIHLSGSASMSTASLSACQGATFSIPINITTRT
jgi:hypothetical protein